MSENGSDILLLVNTGTPTVPVYEAVGSQRNVNFDETTAEIDLSSKTAGRAFRGTAGRYKATLSLDGLYVPTNADYQALRDAMRNGDLILVARQEDGVALETANAIITSLGGKFPDQGESTISIAMTVDGEWSEVGT